MMRYYEVSLSIDDIIENFSDEEWEGIIKDYLARKHKWEHSRRPTIDEVLKEFEPYEVTNWIFDNLNRLTIGEITRYLTHKLGLKVTITT